MRAVHSCKSWFPFRLVLNVIMDEKHDSTNMKFSVLPEYNVLTCLGNNSEALTKLLVF